MPRRSTPSFVAEFPLQTTVADAAALETRLVAARHIFNACLGVAKTRCRLMRQSKDWQAARRLPKYLGRNAQGDLIPNPERRKLFKETAQAWQFTSSDIQKYAEACRNACWINDHLGSHDTQTTSLRAFKAVQDHLFGVRGKPRFKSARQMTSIEGKGNAVLIYRTKPLHHVRYLGLSMPIILDARDKNGWQAQALACPTKYVRIVRRTIRGKDLWVVQLVQEGQCPLVRATREGVVGLDIGPSTIAAVSDQAASLDTFCPTVTQPWQAIRILDRSLDRSRRAANPENYNANGTIKKGPKTWVQSQKHKKVCRKRAEIERKLASERKRSHGEHQNQVLGQGTTIKTEKLSYKAFQKNFGRSIKVRAPGMYISGLRRKAECAGGELVEIRTRHTKLSQFDHTTLDYVKKPLSQRLHVFRDGVTAPVQRDLYSAFLASHCDQTSLDIRQVQQAWPGAEPLLRAAMARGLQLASGTGFARPHILATPGVSERVAA